MASGRVRATSSMSMPPAAEAMHDRQARGAIDHDTEIQLLPDGHPLFHQDPPHPLSLGAGLMRPEHHPQDLGGDLLRCVGRLRQLHAAPLAAAAGVDLGLHDDRPAELLGDDPGLGRGRGHTPPGDRHAELGQDRFGLILMDFHARSVFDVWLTPITP